MNNLTRRDILKVGGGLAVLTLASSCGLAEIYIDNKIAEIEERKKQELRRHIRGIRENMVTLETKFHYMIRYNEISGLDEDTTSGEGLFFGDYILTANHVVNVTKKSIIMKLGLENKFPYFNPENFFFDKINEEVKIGEEILEGIVHNPDKDLAIIPYKRKNKPKYEVKLGNSNKMDLLDETFLVGAPLSKYQVVKRELIGSEVKKSEIITPTRAIFGDSGSPLINNNGEVIAIASEIIPGSHAIFIPINEYREEIEKYEKTIRK